MAPTARTVPFNEEVDSRTGQIRDRLPYNTIGPVPPGDLLEPLDLLVGEASPDLASGIPGHDRVWSHVSCYDCSGSDYGAITDRHSRQNGRSVAQPYVIPNDYRPLGCGMPVFPRPSQVQKDPERIC